MRIKLYVCAELHDSIECNDTPTLMRALNRRVYLIDVKSTSVSGMPQSLIQRCP
jgi:hypothetical protein